MEQTATAPKAACNGVGHVAPHDVVGLQQRWAGAVAERAKWATGAAELAPLPAVSIVAGGRGVIRGGRVGVG
jgi:hypothetical protein